MASPLVTARDFYASLTLIWLFLVMVAIQSTGRDWTGYILPVGALIMLAMYAREWRRHNTPAPSQ